MKTYQIIPKADNAKVIEIKADKLKYDQGHVMMIVDEKKGDNEHRSYIAAVISMDSVRAIVPTENEL